MSLLFLNSISGGEILIVFLISLMLFGADSIPKLARTLGRGIRQIKDATQEIQRDIRDSASNPVSEIRKLDQHIEDEFQDPLNKI